MTDPISRSWRLPAFGLQNLARVEGPAPRPDRGQILVRVRAASLNFKDRLLVDGTLMPGLPFPYVPLSDALGEVVALGEGAVRFKPGDRVLGQVIADWVDGHAPPVLHKRTLAMTLPGVLADYVVLDEEAAVLAPPSLSDVEAATLPIAALTAWSALVEPGVTLPGQTVLIEGTGGVSLFALQFAVAAGLRAIVISSSDEKLEKARSLGAWRGINYRTTAAWEAAVIEATGGAGVDHVVEVVGGDNVRRAVDVLAADGRIALTGILAGAGFSLSVIPFMRRRVTITGVSVGHRRAFERMNQAIEVNAIKPVVDSVFGFDDAVAAFERLAEGPFGKVVVRLDG